MRTDAKIEAPRTFLSELAKYTLTRANLSKNIEKRRRDAHGALHARWVLFDWTKQGVHPQSERPAGVCASHTHKPRVHVKGHIDAVILSPFAPKTAACSARETHLTPATQLLSYATSRLC